MYTSVDPTLFVYNVGFSRVIILRNFLRNVKLKKTIYSEIPLLGPPKIKTSTKNLICKF